MLGTRQHGLPEFRVARLPDDADLLGARPRPARTPWPSLDDPLLREAVDARFGSELDPIPA